MSAAVAMPAPPGMTVALWGALLDLAFTGAQPIPRTAAKLVALGLAVGVGERTTAVARCTRRRIVPRIALTDEGRRVARLAPRSFYR